MRFLLLVFAALIAAEGLAIPGWFRDIPGNLLNEIIKFRTDFCRDCLRMCYGGPRFKNGRAYLTQFPLMYLSADCPEICSSQSGPMVLDHLDKIFTAMDARHPYQDKRDDIIRIVKENSNDLQCHNWEWRDPKTKLIRTGPYGGRQSPGPWDLWWKKKVKQLRDDTNSYWKDPPRSDGHPNPFSKIPRLLPKLSPVFKPSLPIPSLP